MEERFTIKSMTSEPKDRTVKLYSGKDANDKLSKMAVYVPVIAWAIVEHHNDGKNTIEPVFLDEMAMPVVFSQFEVDKNNEGCGYVAFEVQEIEEA